MTFASVDFIIFFIMVLGITAIIERKLSSKWKEIFFLVASYFFYGYWDWRFCFLLLFVTIASYLTAKASHNRWAFTIGIIIPLIVLCVFKYFNFFLSSAAAIIGHDLGALNIILPIGISFYTFQALSYVIDVHRGSIAVENDFIKVALYISFFPQLVAGPIVRASDFLPQLRQDRKISSENIKTGIQIFIFGLFKKIVLADHLSVFVDDVFSKPSAFHWATILLAVVSYSIQVYFDFSGYSDMAIGCAKILGYDFKRNFNLPYISQSVSEYWRRWHISLGGWFRDYLYYPLSFGPAIGLRKVAVKRLGRKKAGTLSTAFVLFVVWVATGFWHGANWTFVFWGVLNGAAVFIEQLRPNKKKSMALQVLGIVATYCFTSFSKIFFRADSFSVAWKVIKGILTFQNGIRQPFSWSFIAIAVLVISTMCAVIKNNKDLSGADGYYPIMNLDSILGLTIFFVVIGLVLGLAYTGDNPFVYFQF